MYRKILVTLDNSKTDDSIISHVIQLAKMAKSEIILVHVADGWAARNFDALKLSESEEMQKDRTYLEEVSRRFSTENIRVSTRLELGNPPTEILKTAEREGCDLIAMTTHGHRLIGDIVLGSTIEAVRHKSNIPLLIVRGMK